ncbi:MAG TPA: FHA domain-containing protein [Thermoleophilaceae bacterium]
MPRFVIIRTITALGESKMQAFMSGTLAGAGSFRCESCGFAVALHERDEVPSCPRCDGGRFRRASIFEDPTALEPFGPREVEVPVWLAEARDMLAAPGWYLAHDSDDAVSVIPLQDGWTRIGRSLAAHVRFDDPTVSRRHALLHCDEHGARILDDRSLNGVFLNGDRIDWHELDDGDEIVIGRFRLYFLSLTGDEPRAASGEVGTAVG